MNFENKIVTINQSIHKSTSVGKMSIEIEINFLRTSNESITLTS